MLERAADRARKAAMFLADHPEMEMVPWVDMTTEAAVFDIKVPVRTGDVEHLGVKAIEREVPEPVRLPQVAADADLQANDPTLHAVAPIQPDVIVDAIGRVEQAGFRPKWILMNVIDYADVRKWAWTAAGAFYIETNRSLIVLGIMGYIGEVTVVASRQAPVGLVHVIPEADAGGRYHGEGFMRISVTR